MTDRDPDVEAAQRAWLARGATAQEREDSIADDGIGTFAAEVAREALACSPAGSPLGDKMTDPDWIDAAAAHGNSAGGDTKLMIDALVDQVRTLDVRADLWERAARIAQGEAAATSPDLVARLVAEVERLRADLDATAYRAGRRQGAIGRVRALAEGWLAEPCVGGYRIPNGNDDDSQCLHCAADVLLEALDGTPRRCGMDGEEWHDAPTCRDCRALDAGALGGEQ